jgi:hypothetical protein
MTGKENCSPNMQNTLSKTAAGALGTRHNVISSNALIQAATKNNRMFRAMVSHNIPTVRANLSFVCDGLMLFVPSYF